MVYGSTCSQYTMDSDGQPASQHMPSVQSRASDILLKNINFIYNCLFCCNHTCYCVNIVSVVSASRYIKSATGYHPYYQSRSWMYIRGLIPQNFVELTEIVPIVCVCATSGINIRAQNYKFIFFSRPKNI